MSQVVVTHDRLQKKRDASLKQEHAINREGEFKNWRMNDISKGYGPITKVIVLALAPLGLLWSLMTALMTFTVGIAIAISKALAYVVNPIIPKALKKTK